MSLPPHREYEESSVPWVGAVPAHWQVLPLIGVARERYESNLGLREDTLLSLSFGRIVRKDMSSNDGLLPESYETYQVVHPGDIVLRLTDLQNDKRSLRTAQVPQKGMITSAYLAITPTGILPSYLAYLLRCYDLKKVFYSMGGGLRQSMKYDDLKRMPVLVPPTEDQAAIADFLDRETAKIDALIAEQEKMLALLAEKRQAALSHAVIRGLDPTVPMKGSGIPWLGEVPAHWIVGPIKRFFEILDSRRVPLSAEERSYRTGEYAYYGASGIIDSIDGYLFDEDLVLVSEDGANLLNRSSPIAFVASGKYWVNNHAHILRPHDGQCAFWAGRIEALDLSPVVSGAAQPKLTIEALANLPVAVPPKNFERAQISRFLAEVERSSLGLERCGRRAVELLKERRSALISAAVTGKIDVRGAIGLDAA